jgi:predicted PurR-regulated permease PerM
MKNLPQNWKIIFSIVSVVVLVWLLWFFRSIVTYLIIAVVISFICDPLADVLKRIRYKRFFLPAWLRALISLSIFLGVFLLLILIFSPLITDEIALISQIDPEQLTEKIRLQMGVGEQALSSYGVNESITGSMVSGVQQMFNPGWLHQIFNDVFGLVGNAVIGLFAVLFMAFFFLKDGFLFARIIFTITPEKDIAKMKNILEHTHSLLKRYFLGVALQSLIMSIMVGMSLYFLGIRNAILIGLFAGIVNVIPYIGPLLGASLGIIIALTTSLHMDFATSLMPLLIKVGMVFLCAQLIDAFLVQPNVLGNSVKAHPLEIFIAILMAGTIGGVVGMVLAIPAYTILRVVAREFLSEFKIVDSLTRDLDN